MPGQFFIVCSMYGSLSKFCQAKCRHQRLSLDENGTEHAKIVQYADDTTLFLRNTHEMRLAINMLEHFGSVAGTQLNLEKCEGLWIDSYKNRQENCSLHNMKWPKVPIRYLGIYIGHDAQKCYKLNFENNIFTVRKYTK